MRYEVIIPTTRGWICVERTPDRAHAEAVAREIAINEENGFHLDGTRVVEVVESMGWNGVPTIHRTPISAFDHEGDRR